MVGVSFIFIFHPVLLKIIFLVKVLFTTFIGCFFSLVVNAQLASDSFSSYQQSIPGSQYLCKMVPIKGGSFTMGSGNKDQTKKPDETPQKTIAISPFWMGAYEVTRDEYDVFFKDESTSANVNVDAITRPSPQYIDFSLGMGKEGGFPANSMSQYNAIMYCRWLYGKTGIFYRLPTEAEWEYACRAGTTTTYFFGNDSAQLDKYAWYSKNSEKKFQKVGQKLPNAWGLYDILGNLSEWTLDHYDEKYLANMADNTKDPMVPFNKAKYPKTLKGGSFVDGADNLRSATRIASDAVWNRRDPQIPRSKWWITDAGFVGFRIVRPQQQPTKEQAEEFYKTYLGK